MLPVWYDSSQFNGIVLKLIKGLIIVLTWCVCYVNIHLECRADGDCKNDGMCNKHSYKCACSDGYTGKSCQNTTSKSNGYISSVEHDITNAYTIDRAYVRACVRACLRVCVCLLQDRSV